MSTPAQLVVRDVSKGYEGRQAISEVSFTVSHREFVSIIGPNASGKSTILKLIAGVRIPDSGIIELPGMIAYMPQEHALLHWRTVLGNLLLPSDIKGVLRDEARKKACELLAEFGLEQYADAYPAALSGGTRQKIALLRTILQEPSLLLLDEPFAPLDALTRTEAQMWLLTLLEKTSASVLLVTHDIREAILLSDSVYILGTGRIREKFSVPLSRPRSHEQLRTSEALELEQKLFSLLAPNL